jgi:hypothetical protein
MKVSELLSDASKWCQGYLAIDKSGDPVAPEASEATSWCLFGALCKCYPYYNYNKTYRSVIEKLYDEGTYLTIPQYNDSPERTFEEIHTLVQELDL